VEGRSGPFAALGSGNVVVSEKVKILVDVSAVKAG
jgi:hypothetical protein